MSDWTEAEIVSLANVSPSDAEEAKAAWRTDAPQAAKRMLEAEAEDAS